MNNLCRLSAHNSVAHLLPEWQAVPRGETSFASLAMPRAGRGDINNNLCADFNCRTTSSTTTKMTAEDTGQNKTYIFNTANKSGLICIFHCWRDVYFGLCQFKRDVWCTVRKLRFPNWEKVKLLLKLNLIHTYWWLQTATNKIGSVQREKVSCFHRGTN